MAATSGGIHLTDRRLRAVSSSIVAVLAALAAPASAHVVGPAGGSGFETGFAHPLSGLDHLLAMLAVGLWSWLQGGGRRLALPVCFVGGAAAGLGLGALAPPAWAAPAALAASVAALGLCTALALRAGLALPRLGVLACGLVHGHAHANELVAASEPAAFGVGFLLATALLHALGFALGSAGPARTRAAWTRAAGAAIAVTGSLLLALALH